VARRLALTVDRAPVGILKAFLFGFVERGFLDQDTLAFITAASPAGPDYHSPKRTVLLGSACEGRVAAGQVDKVI